MLGKTCMIMRATEWSQYDDVRLCNSAQEGRGGRTGPMREWRRVEIGDEERRRREVGKKKRTKAERKEDNRSRNG